MSNTRKAAGDPNAGLVELSIDEAAQVLVFTMFPPGREPVELRLPGAAAWDLGNGILDGAAELLGTEAIELLDAAEGDEAVARSRRTR